ncbi:MAG: amidohydrolase family protein [Halioglobus sp.]|nr:amidohydrolase family protein [Halioglobus sp.]
MTLKAIDPWVNVSMGAVADLPFMQKVKEEYFKAGDDFFRNIESAELVELMDSIGVEKAFLTCDPHRPEQRLLDFTSDYPGRFYIAAQPRIQKGMKALWALEDLARDYPVIMARVTPFELDLPPSDPVYYPLYAKCIEMDIPVGVNTGLPGPPVPGECQHPMHLDRVCLHFPQLQLIMQHGADPWWDIAIRLMIKYRNLYLMTSAYAPRYLPDSLIHYMNTRGKHKIMFASDHPVLSMDRCLEEAKALDLREGVLEKYLYDNANAVLFGERNPRYGAFK